MNSALQIIHLYYYYHYYYCYYYNYHYYIPGKCIYLIISNSVFPRLFVCILQWPEALLFKLSTTHTQLLL